MNDTTAESPELELASPAQRMIGLLLALRSSDGHPVFTYDSLAARIIEESENKMSIDALECAAMLKGLGEQLRRIHRGELVRSRPMLGLYMVFGDEMTHDFVQAQYSNLHDVLERLYLAQDMSKLTLLCKLPFKMPKVYSYPADKAYLAFLHGRALQMTRRDLRDAAKAFELAEEGFRNVAGEFDENPYLRYMTLLAMEARLNIAYALRAKDGTNDAAYRKLIVSLVASGLPQEMTWAMTTIAPSARRAYTLAELLAPVQDGFTAATIALRQAIMIDPRIAHFDQSPFPGEEATCEAAFLAPIAAGMEETDAALLRACRELVPRKKTITEAQRVKLSRQVRAALNLNSIAS